MTKLSCRLVPNSASIVRKCETNWRGGLLSITPSRRSVRTGLIRDLFPSSSWSVSSFSMEEILATSHLATPSRTCLWLLFWFMNSKRRPSAGFSQKGQVRVTGVCLPWCPLPSSASGMEMPPLNVLASDWRSSFDQVRLTQWAV